MRNMCVTWCWVLLASAHLPGARAVGSATRAPLRDFARYKIVAPKLLDGKKHNVILSTLEQDGRHVQHLTIMYDVIGREYILDLVLNTDLIPESYFEKYQQGDSYIIKKSKDLGAELCHYHGHVRGIPGSWAAISTCNGTSGAIFDGEHVHYLENSVHQEGDDLGLESNSSHYVYKHSDLQMNLSCGTPGKFRGSFLRRPSVNAYRFKRDTELTQSKIHAPYNSNENTRYVELVLVVDNALYRKRRNGVFNFCKQLANIISRMYSPLNIYIALVGVVVWNKRNEIFVTSSSDETLSKFLEYRKTKLLKDHPNDNAHLLTSMEFTSGIVGKAIKSSMCSPSNSGGVITDYHKNVGVVAHTLAHEMGHNFGMEHDDEYCRCEDKYCIMAASASDEPSFTWSRCSLEYIAASYEQGLDFCLHNKPTRLFQGPVCGNGFVEDGEECDCGLEGACDNPCCNSSTCKLLPGAKCAAGHCCDLQKCVLKTAGTQCRAAHRECDLPEFCTGVSEYCPDDVFVMDGRECRSGEVQAYCYQGMCRSHESQCHLLWGPSGRKADKMCYTINTCGTDKDPDKECKKRDAVCGRLYCTRMNVDLQFGVVQDASINTRNTQDGRNSVSCVYIMREVAEGEADAGLVPDGAKCGEGQMCVNRKCVPVNNVSHCASNCSGHGVCNSLGHCHCDDRFAPPECDAPGPGGSMDSGPATYPEGNVQLAVSLYTIFLAVVPLLALVALATQFYRNKPKYRGANIASTMTSGLPMYKPTFFQWRPRRNNRTPMSKGRETCMQHQGSSPRPCITRRELVSTTNTAVLATLRVEDHENSPSVSAPKPPVGVGGGRFTARARKVSLSNVLAIKLWPAQKPAVRSLLETSDYSGVSTPETPPSLKADVRVAPVGHSGPSVAQIAARFHDNDLQASEQRVVAKTPSNRPPQPPPQSIKPHFPRV